MLPSLALLQLAGTVAAVAKAHREVAQFDYSATSADGSVAAPLPVGDTCSRKYEGIGGLLNSDAPWLRGFPEPQRSDILDVLFKPQWAGSLQVLKLEVGGDGHSTINTESSHMHTEFDPPSFRRGWVTWLLQEAVKRNPAIRVGGLAWTWPAWTKNSVAKKVSYLTTWCQGIKQQFNVTVEFMGLQNEGQVTGGNEQFATALRASLDAAGFRDTIVDCCDGHDFSFLPQMADPQSDFFKAVGALGIHEPLRNAESVPAAAIATGKPIWSSESYTTYSDSNGGGCWARAINWGWVKGNLTRHMAWNLIQSYPTDGSGMNYNGHGLTWAAVPWAGHYTVAPPIWVSAHYTQATSYGWHFMPVGSGSGMLPAGGSYVSLVSPNGCTESAQARINGQKLGEEAVGTAVDFTMVLQTMEYTMSKCFKDTHAPFTVSSQNVSFTIVPSLLSKLRRAGGGGSVLLYVRRTQLFSDSIVDPVYWVPPNLVTNNYFEKLPPVPIDPDTGTFTVNLGVNEIITLSTIQMHRGVSQPTATPVKSFNQLLNHDDSSGPNLGLATIPNSTAWDSRQQCQDLTGYPVDTALVLAGFPAMDQQGVWEARQSRDLSLPASSAADGAQTTMQQVVPLECDEWHNGGKYKFPQTFIGPPVNLSQSATVSCSVLPPAFENGWAGIGIGGQATSGSTLTASPDVLAVWPNGTWTVYGRLGAVPPTFAQGNTGTTSTQIRWFNLSLTLQQEAADDPEGHPENLAKFTARIDGTVVASGTALPTRGVAPQVGAPPPGVSGSNHPFAFLAASYSTAAGNAPNDTTIDSGGSGGAASSSNAEFKDLCVALNEWTPSHVTSAPPAPPGPSPTPSPPGTHGLGLAHCDASDPRQLWTFSGEDRGEAGQLKPQSNVSLCLDALHDLWQVPVVPQTCGATGSAAHAEQLWKWNSATGVLASVSKAPCKVRSHGVNCSLCLDLEAHGNKVDLFDCKPRDNNQVWSYSPEAGASLLKKGSAGGQSCLTMFG